MMLCDDDCCVGCGHERTEHKGPCRGTKLFSMSMKGNETLCECECEGFVDSVMTPAEIMREFGLFTVEGERSGVAPCRECGTTENVSRGWCAMCYVMVKS